MARNVTPEKQREYNRKSYATKLGLTVEQLEASRQAAREWKLRNKARRTKDGYTGSTRMKDGYKESTATRKTYEQSSKNRDAWWEALKKKHEGKPRLEKSTKPPIFLMHSDREKYELRADTEAAS